MSRRSWTNSEWDAYQSRDSRGNYDISQDEFIDCVYSNGQLSVSYNLKTHPCSHESAYDTQKYKEKVLYMCRFAVLRAEEKIGSPKGVNQQPLWESLRAVLVGLGPSLNFLEDYKQFSST